MKELGTAGRQECWSSIYNHFNHQRVLNRRQIFKQLRASALAGCGVNGTRCGNAMVAKGPLEKFSASSMT